MTAIFVIHWTSERYEGEQLHKDPLGEARVIDSIWSGDVPGTITRIDRYDSDEHTADDITEDIAIAIANRAGNEGDPIRPELRDFIESHAGLAYARGLRVLDPTFAAA
jgi:hypothetical protein